MRFNRTKLEIAMARKKMNQQTLAESSGVSQQRLSYAMNSQNCRPELLGRLSEALGIDVTEIIED